MTHYGWDTPDHPPMTPHSSAHLTIEEAVGQADEEPLCRHDYFHDHSYITVTYILIGKKSVDSAFQSKKNLRKKYVNRDNKIPKLKCVYKKSKNV